jgi:hypothetical protein
MGLFVDKCENPKPPDYHDAPHFSTVSSWLFRGGYLESRVTGMVLTVQSIRFYSMYSNTESTVYVEVHKNEARTGH